MFFPDSFEVAAGLIFVYLFISIIITVGHEAVESVLKRRSRNLEKGITELLCDPGPIVGMGRKSSEKHRRFDILQSFYDHPLIASQYRGNYTIASKRSLFHGNKLPSYISGDHFAYVVLDLLAARGGASMPGALASEQILNAANTLEHARLAKMVKFAINSSGGDLSKAREFLETWYNSAMDRVSGWYRRDTQSNIFWFSLLACIALNINTVVIADTLYRNPSLRRVIEAEAVSTSTTPPKALAQSISNPETKGPEQVVDFVDVNAHNTELGHAVDHHNQLMQLGLPLGWNERTLGVMSSISSPPLSHNQTISIAIPNLRVGSISLTEGPYAFETQTFYRLMSALSIFMGWAMTAFAITLGAPFWFDILSKFMMVRSTFRPNK